MNSSTIIVDDLSRLVGIDMVVAPNAENLVRHMRDYNVQANPDVGVLALTFPRNIEQVSKTLRYCNEHGWDCRAAACRSNLLRGSLDQIVNEDVATFHDGII